MPRPRPAHPTLPADVPAMLVRTATLRERGLSRREIARAVADGRLVRIRRGRYLPAGCHHAVTAAARVGARVDCLSLLELLGVFVRDNQALHVQYTRGASRTPPHPAPYVAHWRSSAAPDDAVLADPVEALAQAVRCQPPRAAIATLDSAWHLGVVDADGIHDVFALLPRRYRRLRGLLDPRCESGPETMMRLMLRSLGCGILPQVWLPGVGFVDFVVDGWLVVECDSEAHHSGWAAQKRDRRRDVAAAGLGYLTVRFLAEDILFHPEQVLAGLKAVLAHAPVRR